MSSASSSKNKKASVGVTASVPSKVSQHVVNVYIADEKDDDDAAEASSDGIMSPAAIARKYNLASPSDNAGNGAKSTSTRPASEPHALGTMNTEMAKKMEQLIVKMDR